MREKHFFSKKMLKKQFLDLEKPKNCLIIPINQSVEEICLMINRNLRK